jgi:hypothetical protein
VPEANPIPEKFHPELLERRHQLFDALEGEYSLRSAAYKVCIAEGLLRKIGDIWMPHTLLMRFWHQSTTQPLVDLAYPAGIRLIKSELTAPEGWRLVSQLRDNLTIEIPNIGRVSVGEQSGPLESQDSYLSPPGIGWRCIHASLYTGASISTLPNDVFVSPDAPLYPDVGRAILAWTGTFAHWGIGRDDKLTIILPEFACRISGLQLGRTETDVLVEPGPSAPRSVIGQYFASTEGQPIVTGRFEGPLTPHTVQIGFVPDWFQVNVFDGESKRYLDGRSYLRSQAYSNKGISYKEKAEDLRAVILSGESEYLELKEAWNGENPRRFKEGVTALANSPSGGTIVFGVKNSPIEIVGVRESWELDEWRLTLSNAVRDSINPIPEIVITEEKVPERLILVQITPGSSPPYVLRNRGVLIRAGSNNRVPEQYELVELVKRGLSARSG